MALEKKQKQLQVKCPPYVWKSSPCFQPSGDICPIKNFSFNEHCPGLDSQWQAKILTHSDQPKSWVTVTSPGVELSCYQTRKIHVEISKQCWSPACDYDRGAIKQNTQYAATRLI